MGSYPNGPLGNLRSDWAYTPGGYTDGMRTTTYDVQGMTCGHCVRSVTEEITEVEGVTSVDVDLDKGTAVVAGDADPETVKAAVVEAGYEVTGVH